MGNGFGRPSGDLPTDIIPGSLGSVTDSSFRPLVCRIIARPRHKLEAHVGKASDVDKAYINMAKGTVLPRHPANRLNVLRAHFAEWCTFSNDRHFKLTLADMLSYSLYYTCGRIFTSQSNTYTSQVAGTASTHRTVNAPRAITGCFFSVPPIMRPVENWTAITV